MAEESKEPKQIEEASAFKNAWEIEAQARREAERIERERQAAEEEAAYRAREAYAKELREDKVDLVKIRSGAVSETDRVHLEHPEEKQYTLGERFGNWLYHAKWWLGVAVFVVFIVGFLVFDYVTRSDPDLRVMVASNITELGASSDAFCGWIAQSCPDYNGNGKQEVGIVYVPVSEETMEAGTKYAESVNMQLLVQFQSSTCMIVIGDDYADPYLVSGDHKDEVFEDLTKLYPDCPFVDGYKLMLGGTNFRSLTGIKDELPQGCYLALRQVHENMDSLENNQKAQEMAKPVLDALVAQLAKE